jgi:hypothetical protein
MYAGSTLTRISGNLIGAHQKIDRVARNRLETLIPGVKFPSSRNILHFEGSNGPDSIKRKSPAKNEPWHFIQPFNQEDNQLIDTITDHYKGLVKALKTRNEARASFEAAWLAHAMVDGLTPAHHFPYEQKLSELRSGEGLETRSTMKKRLVMSGDNRTHAVLNNWKMWGPKGLFTTHASFEFGIATLIAPLSFQNMAPTDELIEKLKEQDIASWYRSIAQEIAKLNLYDDYYKTGWTIKLSNKVKNELAPTLINAVAALWYKACDEANIDNK